MPSQIDSKVMQRASAGAVSPVRSNPLIRPWIRGRSNELMSLAVEESPRNSVDMLFSRAEQYKADPGGRRR